MSTTSDIAEQNARDRALGAYFRWLLKYFGGVELAEMSDEPDPISLRQIYIPLRISTKELPEAELAGPETVAQKETSQSLPGEDAYDLIIKEPWVCLAGLPGSGKTTLVKALLVDLCGTHPSELRRKLMGKKGLIPVPLILRQLGDLSTVKTLDELLERWWANLERQASQGDPLDIPRLRARFTESQWFLLFDGLDESGGEDCRQNIVNLAMRAWFNDHRILVTGRPDGFNGINLDRVRGTSYPDGRALKEILKGPPYQLLPLYWPQIQTFIDKWYRLRPEWEIKRRDGTAHFLEALQDPRRAYLLSLARRPIFLTLMALVHCTRNEMPHGRADLYEAIVDLYLNRQERHRQLNYGVKGKPLKVWPVENKRRVLGYIARQSQLRGAEAKDAGDHPDNRRILWNSADLAAVIRNYLIERQGNFGIAPDEAEELLDYFLHPAGLLVSPREGEIAFAHLSFQEYLCAEDIQRRLTGLRAEKVFRDELAAHLSQPGWNEVGLLLLAIQRKRSEDGHQELLGLLDITHASEATLLLDAVCGQELGFSPGQRFEWLPVLLAACLLHPERELAKALKPWTELYEVGLSLLTSMLKEHSAEQQWEVLQKACKQNYIMCVDVEGLFNDRLLSAWQNLEGKKFHNELSSRLYALLVFISTTRWGLQDDNKQPIIDRKLEEALAINLSSKDFLWERSDECLPICAEEGLPICTEAGLLLDCLLPSDGLLWQSGLAVVPVDAWLLQGECVDSAWDIFSQASVLLSLYPKTLPPTRTRLALGLYQALLLAELGAGIKADLLVARSQLRLKSRVWLRSVQTLPMEFSIHFSLSSSLSHSRLRSSSLAMESELSRAKIRSQWRVLSRSLPLPNQPMPYFPRSTLSSLLSFDDNLKVCVEQDFLEKADESALKSLGHALDRIGSSCAAYDWFDEQAVNPDLVRLRGLKPSEPLPQHLGIFDADGRPLPRQSRTSWQSLEQWLQDDSAVLDFYFPEGLSVEDNVLLREDLQILKHQLWSPHSFIASTLRNWPGDGRDLDVSLQNAGRKLQEACNTFFAAVGNKIEKDNPQ